MLTFEQRQYDEYITSGSGDVCFQYGMSGHCGEECPEFGLRDGCRELVAEEDE